ncbi:carboxypeptidase regulatory-like domain-containing protein [Urbifossiella limnaea]|uniref:Carboxypeptidase regulatory-like domain-containing protein n=1 Tax=Urbifossiella limnaea TaxID=2528023 RepID=A0A517XZ69_9BACT|nr:carboxypeptidase regulatory-like domain-containing protein [Urbifossiella limnaea]QDU22758.1 hypothetical protein ETAA1_47440 [Urbifossiella limnaea]
MNHPLLSRTAVPLALAALLAAAGCGGDGPKLAPVSGFVKVDDQPYPNAVVSFQPVGTKENPSPGRGSSAVTDSNGHYTLYVDTGERGAVVGKHKVRIQTKRDDPAAFYDPTVGSDDRGAAPVPKKGGKVDPIPAEWYSDKGGKDYDVPAGGTEQANFDITSIHAAQKK